MAACACVPVALFCVLCAWNDVYPLGGRTFLEDDLLYQYIDFFAWFRRVLTGDGTLFYTFSQTLGNGAWSQYSYYLGSPLNVLVVLFDPGRLTDAVVTICAIKLVLMQLLWGVFLRVRLRLERWDAFVLALALTWCGWVATDLMNPLWLDMWYLLPMVMLGCWRLVREGKPGLLVGTSACSIMFCWYMGYMTCLFAVCYVLFEAFVAHVENPSLDARFFVRRGLTFAASMVVALMLSAWTFLPTVLSMMGSGRTWEVLEPLELRCGVLDLISSFFVGTYRFGQTPQVFVATLPLVLFGAYLLDRRVDVRVRVATLALLLVGCASVMLAVAEFVWCGFRVPYGFYSRTAFLVPAVLVWGAGRELALIRAEGIRRTFVVAVAVALVACVAVCAWRDKFAESVDAIASLVAIGLTCALLLAWQRACRDQAGMLVRVAFVALAAFVCFELARSGHLQWNTRYRGSFQQQQNAYMDDAILQHDALRDLDDGVWRADKTYTRASTIALNEGLARGYRALSSYTSTMDMRAVDLLAALGYGKPGVFNLCYGAPIEPSDSLLGIRYVFADGVPPALLDEVPISPTRSGGTVYRNPRALPLGYGASEHALAAQVTKNNPFEAQNDLLSAMLGREVRVYEPLVAKQEDAGEQVRSWAVDVPAGMLGYAYATGADLAEQDEIGWLATEGGAIAQQGNRFSHHVMELGDVAKTNRTRRAWLAATRSLAEQSLGLDDQHEEDEDDEAALDPATSCIFYGLDVDACDRALDELRRHVFEPTRFEDGFVAGTYEAEADGWLLMTFPTDPGWQTCVNDARVQTRDALGGAFTAIPVAAGTNRIEMRFVPRGFVAGCVCSVVACGATAAAAFVRARRARLAALLAKR